MESTDRYTLSLQRESIYLFCWLSGLIGTHADYRCELAKQLDFLSLSLEMKMDD